MAELKLLPPCPNYPAHDKVEIAFYDEEFGTTHYHCATDFGNGVICHAEWAVDDGLPATDKELVRMLKLGTIFGAICGTALVSGVVWFAWAVASHVS